MVVQKTKQRQEELAEKATNWGQLNLDCVKDTVKDNLKAGRPINNGEVNVLVRHMADKLLELGDKPGEMGATKQFIKKLFCQYPQLKDNGSTLSEQNVILTPGND